jgi:hypothetical protein
MWGWVVAECGGARRLCSTKECTRFRHSTLPRHVHRASTQVLRVMSHTLKRFKQVTLRATSRAAASAATAVLNTQTYKHQNCCAQRPDCTRGHLKGRHIQRPPRRRPPLRCGGCSPGWPLARRSRMRAGCVRRRAEARCPVLPRCCFLGDMFVCVCGAAQRCAQLRRARLRNRALPARSRPITCACVSAAVPSRPAQAPHEVGLHRPAPREQPLGATRGAAQVADAVYQPPSRMCGERQCRAGSHVSGRAL